MARIYNFDRTDREEHITPLDDEAFEARFYVLSIKGQFYDEQGCITPNFTQAMRFKSTDESRKWRSHHAHLDQIKESQLLEVRAVVIEVW